MADRDINIPFGPDKTGGLRLPEIILEPSGDQEGAIAQPEATPDATVFPNEAAPETLPDSAFEPLPQEEYAAALDSQAEEDIAPAAAPSERKSISSEGPAAADGTGDAPADAIANSAGEEAQDAKQSGNQALGAVQMSFAALKDSIGQGRELKAREKERDALEDKIEVDREELADRDDILANYFALVAEQDRLIAENTQQRETHKATLTQVVAQSEETSEALSRMRDYHDVQLQPLETALGRARASADQAKNDERSRKSELNAAETEVRRAGEGDDATMAKAKLEQVKAAYDEAVARSNAAKEALDEAQKAYDDLHQQVEQAEAPLERSIEDLQKQTDELKDEIARLGDDISTASKRRQYCDSVYQYPEETEKLRRSIQADEASAAQMDAENDELRERLAQSKQNSTKAKVAIGVAIVVVILIICLIWFLSSR